MLGGACVGAHERRLGHEATLLRVRRQRVLADEPRHVTERVGAGEHTIGVLALTHPVHDGVLEVREPVALGIPSDGVRRSGESPSASWPTEGPLAPAARLSAVSRLAQAIGRMKQDESRTSAGKCARIRSS